VITERQFCVITDSMGDSEPFQERGRVIRVPVSNAQGASEARQVHARLTFLPDDPTTKPMISDTLTVECRARSMLIADWTDIGDLGTNHVGWKSGYNA